MPDFLKGQQSFVALLVIIAVILIGGIIIFGNRDQGEVTEEAASESEQVEQKENEVSDLKKRIEEAAPEAKEELEKQLEERQVELGALQEEVITQLQQEVKDLTERAQEASEEEKADLEKQVADKKEELGGLQEEKEAEESGLPAEYTVAKGDHLWGIATKFYNDGYKWTVLAAENSIQNPDIILPGQNLTIPEPKEQTYTVVAGNTLWGISERFYGTGFKWTIIRDANPGAIGVLPNGNPLIVPGQVLKIP